MYSRLHSITLHSNKHQCPHLVPSVGFPFFSALALILFHPFLPSSSCWMYLCKSEMGMKDTLCRVFSCGSQTSDLPLTSNRSSARLPRASSFAAWTWQNGDLTNTASAKSCAFSCRFKKICYRLPTCYSTHLCFSSSVSVFLPLFEVFNPWEPEDPLQPLGPWVNAGPTNTPFCTLSHKDMDATPSHREERLSRSVLLNEYRYSS